MSENNHEELFKTTLMGGFDKDDRDAEPQDPRA